MDGLPDLLTCSKCGIVLRDGALPALHAPHAALWNIERPLSANELTGASRGLRAGDAQRNSLGR